MQARVLKFHTVTRHHIYPAQANKYPLGLTENDNTHSRVNHENLTIILRKLLMYAGRPKGRPYGKIMCNGNLTSRAGGGRRSRKLDN